MINFDYYSPTYFAFGKEKEYETGKLAKQFGATKVLLHYGGGSVIKSGLLERVKASLINEGIEFAEFGGVMPNPRAALVYEGIELCKKENFDFILAVGGGSVIDSAKAIAAGALYEGDFWDFFSGKVIEKALPVGTVLTIAASGSEGSPTSVIANEELGMKHSTTSNALRPKFSIMNPTLTQTLPAYQSACGITDIIAHLYERYLTNTDEVELTDRLIESVILTMIHEGPRVIDNPDNYDARANIMWAGMMAHNNIVGVGRTQDWTSHAIEHELAAEYDTPHGAGLAVIMPAVFAYTMKHDIDRFVQIATRVWEVPMNESEPEITAKAGIEALQSFLISIGMPRTLSELGCKSEALEKMAHAAATAAGGKVGGFMPLEEEQILDILKNMY